ncbi:hypothetical protein [Fuerstiella marisgermanici]|nr:hypothetical protein [Fuerstiella marisgermanici]
MPPSTEEGVYLSIQLLVNMAGRFRAFILQELLHAISTRKQ